MAGADDLTALLAEKEALENQLIGSEPEKSKVAGLLRTLRTISRSSVGTLSFRWPGHPHPLHLRCGTTDLSNFVQIFLNKEYDVPLPYSPARILDLGGYVGYAAAYLAAKYPRASIVSVEPLIDNFRINRLNTAGFENVRGLNAGVSDTAGSLIIEHSVGGDWGSKFTAAPDGAGGTPSYTLQDLMTWAGWDSFDFLKCDIEGSEREVFIHSRNLIAANVAVCAVELHEIAAPGSERAVNACFDDSLFERFKHGEFNYFVRRDALMRVNEHERVLLLKQKYGLRKIELIDVPEPTWGYYVFEGASCQLHPGDIRGKPAILRTQVELSGQTMFESEVSVFNPRGFAVKFTVALRSADTPIFTRELVVAAGGRNRIVVETGPLEGMFEATLATQMADGATTNHKAVANWHQPSFF